MKGGVPKVLPESAERFDAFLVCRTYRKRSLYLDSEPGGRVIPSPADYENVVGCPTGVSRLEVHFLDYRLLQDRGNA
jgi:hypothetical protein